MLRPFFFSSDPSLDHVHIHPTIDRGPWCPLFLPPHILLAPHTSVSPSIPFSTCPNTPSKCIPFLSFYPKFSHTQKDLSPWQFALLISFFSTTYFVPDQGRNKGMSVWIRECVCRFDPLESLSENLTIFHRWPIPSHRHVPAISPAMGVSTVIASPSSQFVEKVKDGDVHGLAILSSTDPCNVEVFFLVLFLSTDTNGMDTNAFAFSERRSVHGDEPSDPTKQHAANWQRTNTMESTFGSSVELFALDRKNKAVTRLDKEKGG
ncbi:MAG: hypothetical protein BYD32DRAFT_406399 [Podila humilis]|nr:MAG: hypothetical protein BYD32DRAFT_406399 [Podila humilis]